MLNLMTDAAPLIASVLVGVLWDRIGAQATYRGAPGLPAFLSWVCSSLLVVSLADTPHESLA